MEPIISNINQVYGEFTLYTFEISKQGVGYFRTLDRRTVISEASSFCLWNGLSNGLSSRRKLNFTDLKVIDPAFNKGATLRLLKTVIILSLFDVKALIYRDKVQIFNPENERMKVLSELLMKRLEESKELHGKSFIFELFVLDTLFTFVSQEILKEFEPLEQNILHNFQKINNKNFSQFLATIRMQKDKLFAMDEKIKIPHHLLTQFLEEEVFVEDAGCTSNKTPENLKLMIEQRLELFQCLDASILLLETICERVDSLLENVKNREDVLSTGMDCFRNRVIAYDLIFTTLSSAVSFTSLFGACFGTNILVPLELSNGTAYGWYGVVGGTLFFVIVFSIGFLYFFKGAFKYLGRKKI
eukprot:jgi/Galph1/263/GphlegSOOS_G4987.1